MSVPVSAGGTDPRVQVVAKARKAHARRKWVGAWYECLCGAAAPTAAVHEVHRDHETLAALDSYMDQPEVRERMVEALMGPTWHIHGILDGRKRLDAALGAVRVGGET